MAYEAKLPLDLVAMSTPLPGGTRILLIDAETNTIKHASKDEILAELSVDFDVQVDTLADRGAYDGEAAGYRVLVSDVGDGRAALYTLQVGGSPTTWSAPAYMTSGGDAINDEFINSIAELGTAADRYIYTTAVDTAAEGVITAATRALLASVSNNAFLAALTATRTETGAIAYPLLSKLREQLSITDFGAVGDGRIVAGGSGITNGSPTLVANPFSFFPTDQGKMIAVANAATGGEDLITTILAYVSDTTVTLATNATATVASAYAMLGTDNTAAINNAILAAKVTGGDVLIPPGTYCSGRINFNSCIGVHIRGTGKQSGAGPTNFGSHLWPLISAFSGDPAIDWSGSTHCSINNVQIGRSDLLGQASVGLLLAGRFGAESTHLDLNDVFVIGTFGYSALYQFGVPDCTYTRCQFYQYRNHGVAAAVVLTATNIRGVTSPNETLNTGTLDASNAHFINTHIIEQGNTGGLSDTVGLLLDSVGNILIHGANIISTLDCIAIADQDASSGTRALHIANSNLSGTAFPVAHVIRIDSTHTIKGITLDNNQYNQGDDALTGAVNSSLVRLPSGGRVDGLRILGHPVAGVGCKAVDHAGNSTALHGVGWHIECGGLAIDIPGSVDDLTLINPGTVSTVAGAVFKQPGRFEEFEVDISGDETTNVSTGTNKRTRNMRHGFMMLGCRASCSTVSSSGLPTVDINKNGTTCLSTKLTIDASEKTSDTAATPAVISVPTFAAGDEMAFDVDVAGTGCKGLKVQVWGLRTS